MRTQHRTTLLKREQGFPVTMSSSPQYRNYSIVGDADGALSRLESLKVFTPSSGASTLDLVDVTTTSPKQVQQRTFTNTADLEYHIDNATILGGTRYV